MRARCVDIIYPRFFRRECRAAEFCTLTLSRTLLRNQPSMWVPGSHIRLAYLASGTLIMNELSLYHDARLENTVAAKAKGIVKARPTYIPKAHNIVMYALPRFHNRIKRGIIEWHKQHFKYTFEFTHKETSSPATSEIVSDDTTRQTLLASAAGDSDETHRGLINT
jgi:hypothetical protein